MARHAADINGIDIRAGLDHHLVDELGVFFQRHVDGLALTNDGNMVGIAYATDADTGFLAPLSLERIAPFGIGNGDEVAMLQLDGGTDERLFLLITNISRQR